MSLEVFLLAMLDRGLTTVYDFREQAGVSIGATTPALHRLEQEGLVAQTENGRRNEFSLTAAGRRRLKNWQQDFERHPATDFDDILRTAYLSWLLGGPKLSTKFLVAAAKARRRTAETRLEDAQRLLALFQANPNGSAFLWMKTAADAARAATDAATLTKIQRELARRTPAK